jgi:hypothetical protein
MDFATCQRKIVLLATRIVLILVKPKNVIHQIALDMALAQMAFAFAVEVIVAQAAL